MPLMALIACSNACRWWCCGMPMAVLERWRCAAVLALGHRVLVWASDNCSWLLVRKLRCINALMPSHVLPTRSLSRSLAPHVTTQPPTPARLLLLLPLQLRRRASRPTRASFLCHDGPLLISNPAPPPQAAATMPRRTNPCAWGSRATLRRCRSHTTQKRCGPLRLVVDGGRRWCASAEIGAVGWTARRTRRVAPQRYVMRHRSINSTFATLPPLRAGHSGAQQQAWPHAISFAHPLTRSQAVPAPTLCLPPPSQPPKVTYRKLLDTFFERVDPTTRDRQGSDRGSQYRR